MSGPKLYTGVMFLEPCAQIACVPMHDLYAMQLPPQAQEKSSHVRYQQFKLQEPVFTYFILFYKSRNCLTVNFASVARDDKRHMAPYALWAVPIQNKF
jgi:hypothetical protein